MTLFPYTTLFRSVSLFHKDGTVKSATFLSTLQKMVVENSIDSLLKDKALASLSYDKKAKKRKEVGERKELELRHC